ncbi:MAG: TonB-dependent receptor [Bacteroidales bacterium]|jgi:hypothetical protein|nr:TonB-dependent receptor [Bacteroidales bacterium]
MNLLYIKRISIILLFLFFPLFLFSQNAIIRGFVYEKETGEPVIFTNVYLHKTTHGAATDVNGFYTITNIPVGSYTLMVTSLGYDTLQMPVVLKKGEIISKQLFLAKAAYTLATVNVTADREEARTETRTSVVKITPKQIKSLPAVGGQADLAQYLQVLPGVVFTGDQGGQLYIRGGSPIQNKVLLDGMMIYNPFHSIGLFSVFDTDILRNVDVYTGGFGAEHGGRISSVMDLTTRDGNRKRLAGNVEANTFGGKILLEGPLSKQDEDGSGSSFVLSAKSSYLEKSSKILYKYVNEDGLPFNFLDLYGKVSMATNNGSKINLFGFNFTDQVKNYNALSDFNWQNYGGGSNFVIIPGQSPVLMEGNFSYTNYKITLAEANKNDRTSQIAGFNAGLNFSYFMGKNEFKYGFELQGFKTDYYFFNALNRIIQQKENTTEIAGYLKYKYIHEKFLFEPSFRIQWYASLGNFSPEPRLAIKYNATDWMRFKLATGLYSQNLISASSDRDVVNLFYGFLSGPDNLPKKFDGELLSHKLQKAGHLIVGVEFDLLRNLSLNVEGYYKDFSQLTNLNRNKIFEDTPEYSSKPDELKKDFIIETGSAKGIDFMLKYDRDRFYFWAVYSLSYVDRYDGTITYNPHFDRRHNINLLGTYTFGSAYNWELSARWNFGSGFPFTLSQGYYEKINFSNGIYTDPANINGDLGILYAEQSSGRLPNYHRLDINLKHKIELGRYSRVELNVGATNVYDQKNIFYFDRVRFQRVDQLPFMYSAGVNYYF